MEDEMNNTKAWAIISTIAVVIAGIIAGTMFFLGLTVGQNSASRENQNESSVSKECDCDCAKEKS